MVSSLLHSIGVSRTEPGATKTKSFLESTTNSKTDTWFVFWIWVLMTHLPVWYERDLAFAERLMLGEEGEDAFLDEVNKLQCC